MKRITKIVTFYDDGTFTESTPSPGWMPTPYVPPAPYTPTPNPYYPPTNPWVNPYPTWPNTIMCKTADGTVTEMKLNGPIVAQGTKND